MSYLKGKNMPNIRLDKIAVMLDGGDTTKIGVTVENADKIRFVSNDYSVAVVDGKGNVTALNSGDAIITVSALNTKTGDAAEEKCHISVDYIGQNPILPPTWGLFMADGEMYEFDGMYYMYGSKDYPFATSPEGRHGWCSRDYHVICSNDLIHWTDVGVVLTVDDVPGFEDSKYHLWAPDLFKAPNGKYYLLSCTEYSVRKYFISESDSPSGPFVNTRRIEVPGSDKGIEMIDPGVLVDDDGTVYMATTDRDIYILDPKTDYSSTIKDSRMCIDLLDDFHENLRYIEGPSLRKRGDIYYYIFIASRKDVYAPAYMEYLYTRDIKNPYSWKYGGTVITTYGFMRPANVHGSICEARGEWYLSYHRLAPGFMEGTRVECLDKVEFNSDGTIIEVTRTSSGVRGAFKLNENIPAASAIDFSGGVDDHRMTLRGIKNNYEYEVTGYAYAYFDEVGQYIGYRYVDFETGADNVTVSVRTAGGVLKVRNGVNGYIIVAIELPDTDGKWVEVTVPIIKNISGRQEVYFELFEGGNTELDWFRFNKEKI